MQIFLQAGGAAPASGGFDWTWILLMVGFVAIIYFLMIRPQRKQQKELQAKLGGMQKGDKVLTTGGMYGIITAIKDQIVVIRIGEGVRVEIIKSAIQDVQKREIGRKKAEKYKNEDGNDNDDVDDDDEENDNTKVNDKSVNDKKE